MKYIELFESWFPKKWAEDNQENVIIEYCKLNNINYSELNENNKKEILQSIGNIRVKVEVVYPPSWMMDKYTIQDINWDVTQKRIFLRLSSTGKSASIDRCKILEYLPNIFDGSHPLIKKGKD
jgi:hypothetical protein